MNLNFDFPLPTKEEFQTVKELAESIPEALDGGDLWILRNFDEGDFQ